MKRNAILFCISSILLSACNTTRSGHGLSGATALETNPANGIVCALPAGLETRLATVYFDYDSALLRADTLEVLQGNAGQLRTSPDPQVLIAGHCDERGTQEYNLALGQKRAERVREYLVGLGIPRERLTTISFGEEYPADPGHSESAWRLNRRCEFEAN